MSYETGLSVYDGNGGPSTLHRKPFDNVRGVFFWWIHRFSSDEAVLDVGFGGREFVVESMLYYRTIEAAFAPWELLLAHEVSDVDSMSGNTWVVTTDFMEKTIAVMAAGVRRYWPILSRPDPIIIKRALELREGRMIDAQKEQRRRDRERASIQASRAFHENRFEEAIKLLSPYKDDEDLPRSSAMLLEMALKKHQ